MPTLNYKNIPKFTGSGHYRINADLQYIKIWIDKNIEELNLQLNPDFQRGNVWNKSQKSSYVEFLIKGGQSSREVYFNHPGWMNDFIGEFVCVDGLQRITAILEFLDNKLMVFGNYLYRDIEEFPPHSIDLVIHVNDLKTRKEVLKWYLEFNSGGTVHAEAELDKVRKMIEED